MLRNLRTARFLGTPYRGIKGSAIPVGSLIYNDLNLPADAEKEYSIAMTAWPASGSLYVWEDGSYRFTPANDGTFYATGTLIEDGVAKDPQETLTLQSGVAGATVSCGIGSASATGAQATVSRNVTISATVGNASASGAQATITSTATGTTIACSVGQASATGASATITGAFAAILIPNAHQMYVGQPRIRTYRSGMAFSPKRNVETEIFSVNYADMLGTGETITAATWTATVNAGEDATPNAIVQGAPTITGAQVSTLLTAGIPGVRYAPICTAQTSLGQVLVLPVYGDGLLEVTL